MRWLWLLYSIVCAFLSAIFGLVTVYAYATQPFAWRANIAIPFMAICCAIGTRKTFLEFRQRSSNSDNQS
jgi:hypothetical protein